LGVRTVNPVGAAYRQFAVSFDPCITYTNPNINQQLPEITGTNATCVGGTNPIYTTTQPFTNYNWTVIGGTIISGQGTRTIAVDWTETGAKSVNIATIDANGCNGKANFAVTINDDPSVSVAAEANKAVICQGQNVTLSATTTGGTGTPTFQWFSSTDNATWAKINGATSSSYIASGNNLGITYYQAEITFKNAGCNKATSVSTSIETVAPLTIKTQLAGFTECLGGTKKLDIDVVGGKNTTYQWQTSLDGTTDWKDIKDETSTSYIPTSIAVGQKYYRVVIKSISSGCSSIESNPVQVIIVADPTISVSVTATSVCTGGTVVLSANVTDASNSCTIEWYSKANVGDWTKIPNATGATYTAETLNNTTRYKVGLNCAASGCCN
jgi:large repetitive protein